MKERPNKVSTKNTINCTIQVPLFGKGGMGDLLFPPLEKGAGGFHNN